MKYAFNGDRERIFGGLSPSLLLLTIRCVQIAAVAWSIDEEMDVVNRTVFLSEHKYVFFYLNFSEDAGSEYRAGLMSQRIFRR